MTLTKLTWVAVAGALLVGCASKPAAPPEADRTVPLDASNMVAAQKAGYKMVNEDGKVLYCKRSSRTGTHARKETQCLTAEEWQEAQEASQRGVETMRRTTPPKQDKRG